MFKRVWVSGIGNKPSKYSCFSGEIEENFEKKLSKNRELQVNKE
jgi:hypothetical protein